MCPSGQAESIAEQGAREKRRGWAPPVGTYHELGRAANAGCQVTRRPRSWSVSLKEVVELYGTTQRRPSPPARSLAAL